MSAFKNLHVFTQKHKVFREEWAVLIVLSASLSDSEREAGESKGRGQRPQSLCFFALFVICLNFFGLL